MIDGKIYLLPESPERRRDCVNVRARGPRRFPVSLSDFPTRVPGSTNHGIFWVRPVVASRYFPTRSRKRPSRTSYSGTIIPLNGPARTTPPSTRVAAQAVRASWPVGPSQAAITTVTPSSAAAPTPIAHRSIAPRLTAKRVSPSPGCCTLAQAPDSAPGRRDGEGSGRCGSARQSGAVVRALGSACCR